MFIQRNTKNLQTSFCLSHTFEISRIELNLTKLRDNSFLSLVTIESSVFGFEFFFFFVGFASSIFYQCY